MSATGSGSRVRPGRSAPGRATWWSGWCSAEDNAPSLLRRHAAERARFVTGPRTRAGHRADDRPQRRRDDVRVQTDPPDDLLTDRALDVRLRDRVATGGQRVLVVV